MASPGGSNLGTATLQLRAGDRRLKKDLADAEAMTQKRLERFSRKAQTAGLLAAGVGAALTVPLALSVKTFAEFEQNMANVKAVSGATAAEFTALTDIAQKMGATTVFTANQAAQALSFMSMAGLEARESIGALPSVLNLAAAGQLELADSADIVTNIMAGYGIATEDVGRATDVLVKGFTSANTDLLQLGEAFTYAGPVAKAAGLAFEETAAALALMGNAGFQGSLAGTSLRGALSRLLRPSGEAADIMQRLGVTVLDAQGELLPFIDILTQFETFGLSAADAMTIFGLRAGPAMLALVGQGSDALRQLTFEMENSGGTAERIARMQLDTFQGQMTLLTSAVDGLAISIGSTLVPILRKVVEFITPLVGGFTRWAEKNKGLATGITVTVGALGAFLLVGGLALVMAGILAAAWGALGITFAGVAGFASAMWLAILGPVGLAIAGVAAIIAVAVILYKRFDAVRNLIDKITLGIFRMGDAASAIGGVETREKVPRKEEEWEKVITWEGKEEEDAKGMVEIASSLITGRTRWTNVREEEAQENQFDRIIKALEGQTVELNEETKGQTAELVEALDIELQGLTWKDYVNPLNWQEILDNLEGNAVDLGIKWADWIKSLDWGDWIPSLDWGKSLTPLNWREWITSLDWVKWLTPLSWLQFLNPMYWVWFVTKLIWALFIKGLLWEGFIKDLLWEGFIKGFLWETFIKGLLWETFIKGFLWETVIKGFLWETVIKRLLWGYFIKGFLWEQVIKRLLWGYFIKGFLWETVIKGFLWGTVIKGFLWGTVIKGFLWGTVIKGLLWRLWIPSLNWRLWIPSLNWRLWIPSLNWRLWIPSLNWRLWIPSLNWRLWVPSLNWRLWVPSLNWRLWIPGLSWWTWIGTLSWWTWIPSLSWWSWIGKLSWWTWIGTLNWRTWIPSLSWWSWIGKLSWWTWISSIGWSSFIPSITWSSFIPAFSWPSLPKFSWPSISAPSWPSWVPGAASGGIAMSPMLLAVAEEKPEAIVPLDRLETMIAGAGGGGSTINVHGDLYGYDDFVEKVTEAGFLFGRRGG